MNEIFLQVFIRWDACGLNNFPKTRKKKRENEHDERKKCEE